MYLILLLVVTLFYLTKATAGINAIVGSLDQFQTEDGGFRSRYATSSLQFSADALFLASFFGVNDKINSVGVAKFIQNTRNADGGFGERPGAVSDVASVRYALKALSYIKSEVDKRNSDAIEMFLASVYDNDSKMFSMKKGGQVDIRATAYAFECYKMLDLLENDDVVEKMANFREVLKGVVKSDGNNKYFFSITIDNAYAVIAASLAGFEFEDKAAWINYFKNRQITQGFSKGGFYSDSDHVDFSIEDACLSIEALHHLEGHLVGSIDSNAFIEYSHTLQADLGVAALAYSAISQTRSFTSLFRIEVVYHHREPRHRVVGNRIVQGSHVKPGLIVKSYFGIPHSSLDVSLTLVHDNSPTELKLEWNSEIQAYIADDYFDSEGKMGLVELEFSVKWDDEDEELEAKFPTTLSIGYWSVLKSKASFSGKDIEVGGVVELGTTFSFTATYGTALHKPTSPLKSGPFSVIFAILDSSDHVIHESSIDGSSEKPFKFDYTLASANIPAGPLNVRVSVKDSVTGVVHTVDTVSYTVQTQMVASELKFVDGKNAFKIGEKIQVSMVPAVLPDLRTANRLSLNPRSFFLNVHSAQSSTVIDSYAGVFDQSSGAYTFTFEVSPTFDSVGTHIITFFYKTSNDVSIPLKLFDSQTKYLFDVGQSFSYKVDSKLIVVDDNQGIKEGALQYGNDVTFTFRVLDDVSKKYIWNGKGDAVAYLVLRHDIGKPSVFTSVKHAATQIPERSGTPPHFLVEWSVNPNAFKGPASLLLIAEDADGVEIPLLKGSQPWAVKVDIGGNIEVTQTGHSGVLGQSDLFSFFVTFDLTCQTQRLKGAQLFASVRHVKSNRVIDVPVAFGVSGYQVSWTLNKKQALGGEYQIDIFRQVDRKRNALAEPFVTISHFHVPPESQPFPVRTEFLVFIMFLSAFVWASFKKNEILGTKKK